jgi:pyrroloquinoline quinone biosynthesis protein D
MSAADQTVKPRLAAGCRWTEANGDERTLLFPEGAIVLRGTGRDILERCDGESTVHEIVEALQAKYGAGDPARIAQDVASFLEQLQQKRIVDL